MKEQRRNPETGRNEFYWKIAYRREGKQRREALGFIPEKEAKSLLKKWEARHELGLDKAPPRVAPRSPGAPTLREWWGDTTEPWPTWPACRMLDWIDARNLAPKTKRSADSARRVFVAEIGGLRLDQVTSATGDTLLAALRRRGLKSKSCIIYLDWLRRSLAVAVDDKLIPAVPKLQRPLLNDRKAARWYTPDQTAALLAELDRRVELGITDRDVAVIIRAQEALLMRPGEVLHTRWERLAHDRAWKKARLSIAPAELPDGTMWFPKLRKERTVAVPPMLLALLRDQWLRQGQPAEGWIFPREGDARWPRSSYTKALAGACKALGLPVLHPHALRHTGATRLALNGVERRTLMQIGGWTTGEMLDEVYEHTTDARVEEVLARAEVGTSGALPAADPFDGPPPNLTDTAVRSRG